MEPWNGIWGHLGFGLSVSLLQKTLTFSQGLKWQKFVIGIFAWSYYWTITFRFSMHSLLMEPFLKIEWPGDHWTCHINCDLYSKTSSLNSLLRACREGGLLFIFCILCVIDRTNSEGNSWYKCLEHRSRRLKCTTSCSSSIRPSLIFHFRLLEHPRIGGSDWYGDHRSIIFCR